MDRVRNETVREQCGIINIVRIYRKRRKEWDAHVEREQMKII